MCRSEGWVRFPHNPSGGNMKTEAIVYMLKARDNDVIALKAAEKIECLQNELNQLKEQVNVLIETSKVSREIRSITKEIRELNSLDKK